MRCVFRPRDRDRTTEMVEGFWWVLGHFEGMLGCNTHEALSVPRLTVGVSNEVQMARNLAGGIPVVNQGRMTSLGQIRKHLTPAHEKR